MWAFRYSTRGQVTHALRLGQRRDLFTGCTRRTSASSCFRDEDRDRRLRAARRPARACGTRSPSRRVLIVDTLEPTSSARSGRHYDAAAGNGAQRQQRVQAARHADQVRRSARREQRAGHVGVRRSARVVADRQALVGEAEDHLRRDDEARQAHGVDLRAADRRAAGLLRPVQLLDRVGRTPGARPRPSRSAISRAVPLGTSGLVRARVVDDLPRRQVARGQERRGLAHRGRQREIPRRDHADRPLARRARRCPRSPRPSAPTCRLRPTLRPRSPPARWSLTTSTRRVVDQARQRRRVPRAPSHTRRHRATHRPGPHPGRAPPPTGRPPSATPTGRAHPGCPCTRARPVQPVAPAMQTDSSRAILRARCRSLPHTRSTAAESAASSPLPPSLRATRTRRRPNGPSGPGWRVADRNGDQEGTRYR